jgi:hypothetical protein
MEQNQAPRPRSRLSHFADSSLLTPEFESPAPCSQEGPGPLSAFRQLPSAFCLLPSTGPSTLSPIPYNRYPVAPHSPTAPAGV